jgi:hypothetical protein
MILYLTLPSPGITAGEVNGIFSPIEKMEKLRHRDIK